MNFFAKYQKKEALSNLALSLGLTFTKLMHFIFISYAVVAYSDYINISVLVVKATSYAGIYLILIGPLVHRQSMNTSYRASISISSTIFILSSFLIFMLDLELSLLVALTANFFGRSILDTIFINQKLIQQRSIFGISLDILRIALLYLGARNPIIFLIPLLIDLLIIFYRVPINLIKEKIVGRFIAVSDFRLFWWILTQTIPSFIFIFHLDKLENSEIYAYCILLASQISGFLETFFSVYWFDTIAKIKNKGKDYAYKISFLILMSCLIFIALFILSIFISNAYLNISEISIDIFAVLIFVCAMFGARFATLNMNHIILYSSSKDFFNIIFSINILVFILMFFYENIQWQFFVIPFFVTSFVMLISQKKAYTFSKDT